MQNGKGRGCNVHIAPSPLCRAAYTEQALKAAVLTGTKQYVMLGAGMDSFAFREKKFLLKHRVFEVDHPLTRQINGNGLPAPDGQFTKILLLFLWTLLKIM